ncbi:MAG: DUF5814 domain-containing protein [Euryarchaeota archaeon]|nr:DUF5814 domain-containing protein [Euryarchaeota archaeon]
MFPAKAKLVYAKKLGSVVRYRVPDGAFHGTVLELLASGTGLEQLDNRSRDQYLAFFRAFINTCSCKTRPFCGCPERLFIREVIELRQSGWTHKEIADYLLDEYGIALYPTDILSFLEESVHVLEAIHRVSMLSDRPEVSASAASHITLIEGREIGYVQQHLKREAKTQKLRKKVKKNEDSSLSVQDVVAFSQFEKPKQKKKKKKNPEKALSDTTFNDFVQQATKKQKKKKTVHTDKFQPQSQVPPKKNMVIDAAEYMPQTSRTTKHLEKKDHRIRSITLPPTKE